MYKSRVLLFTGNSCPVRVLKTSFKVAPFPEGGGIDFPGQCGMSRDHLLSSFDLKKKKKKKSYLPAKQIYAGKQFRTSKLWST